MEGRSLRELNGKLLASTPTDRAHFFGFYDICPWAYQGNQIVLLSCDRNLQKTPTGETADVNVWVPESGAIRKIGETTGWNFQHGARTRWLRNGNILFNDLDQGRQCARIVGPDGSAVRTLEMSVAALHPEESFAVSPNYAHLANFYPAYGYHAAKNPHINRADPAGDGLWRVDLATGTFSLLLSYRRLCEELRIRFTPRMFVTHPDFSPSGRKISFFLIEERGGGSQYMWLLVYDVELDAVSLVNGDKNSHPTWIDDNRLFVWARCSPAAGFIRRSGILSVPGVRPVVRLIRSRQGSGVGAAISEGFYVFETDNGNRKTLVSPKTISEDGHPSRHPVRKIVLCDTYPDRDGYLTLFLYSLESGERVDICQFFHGVKTTDVDMRCDLHPRWNRAGNRISVDYCEGGIRRMAVVDPTAALAML